MRIGNIVLQRKPLHTPDKTTVKNAIFEAIHSEGETLLSFNDEANQIQNRVMSMRIRSPKEHWPDYLTSALLENVENWLEPYLIDIKRNEDLEKISLKEILNYSLSPQKQKQLSILAPKGVNVPSGSSIKVKYSPHGSPPVLAVRQQEVFGMSESPTVNQGKMAVIMHLLSPGFKIVQITLLFSQFVLHVKVH